MGAKSFAMTATIRNTEEITYHMDNVFAYIEFAPITRTERNSQTLKQCLAQRKYPVHILNYAMQRHSNAAAIAYNNPILMQPKLVGEFL